MIELQQTQLMVPFWNQWYPIYYRHSLRRNNHYQNPAKRRNLPYVKSEPTEPCVAPGSEQGLCRILQKRCGVQQDTPTHNSWQSRHIRINEHERMKKWCRNLIETLKKYFQNQLQNACLLTNHGTMLLTLYLELQKPCEPKFILCPEMNRRSWIDS